MKRPCKKRPRRGQDAPKKRPRSTQHEIWISPQRGQDNVKKTKSGRETPKMRPRLGQVAGARPGKKTKRRPSKEKAKKGARKGEERANKGPENG